MLASCETIEQVKHARARGYATSIVIPEHETTHAYKVEGIKYVPCPEQTRGTTCENCRMCMRTEKLRRAGITIVFSAHGQDTKRVKEILQPNCPDRNIKNDGNGGENVAVAQAVKMPEAPLAPATRNDPAAPVEDSFSHLFDREHQIAMIQSAIDSARASKFENRFHCVLHGPPGCGKTDILNSFANMLGQDQILKFDGTNTTKSGATNLLLETENLPPFLFIEEIEKADEHSLSWLLGVMDHRAEIRKVNFNTSVATAQTKVLCVATANDINRLSGALASRFVHKIGCPRPTRQILEQILLREIKKIDGKPEWAAPTLDYCLNVEKSDDPRRLISVCLSGGNKLLTGEYQKHLAATNYEKPTPRSRKTQGK